MFITSYTDFNTGLDEAPKKLKGRSLHNWILKNLKSRERISTFELEANYRVCRTVMFLVKLGKINLNSKNYTYPYIGVTVND